MAQEETPIHFAASGPTVIMVCGVNGSGKTTTIAKLAQHVQVARARASCSGRATRFAPRRSSSSRSGASGWGSRSSPASRQATRPASPIARWRRPSRAGTDVCIVDTAGRLQTQKNLMAELTKIQDSIRKQLPEAPHEVLLVLDATTGQNGISQAMKFTEAVNCTGIVLAKLDGTAKGGVVVAIRQQVGLPVKYLGVGEQPDDLTPFVGRRVCRRAVRRAGLRRGPGRRAGLTPAISTPTADSTGPVAQCPRGGGFLSRGRRGASDSINGREHLAAQERARSAARLASNPRTLSHLPGTRRPERRFHPRTAYGDQSPRAP